VIQKAKEWIESTVDKIVNRGNVFQLDQFLKINIKYDYYLPILRATDPLQQYTIADVVEVVFEGKRQQQVIYFKFTESLYPESFKSLNPNCLAINFALDDFYKALRKIGHQEKKGKYDKIYIIGPTVLETYKDSQSLSAKQFEKRHPSLSSANLLIMQVCHKGHYVTAEVDLVKANEEKEWTIMVADSCRPEENKEFFDKSNEFLALGVTSLLDRLQPEYKVTIKCAENSTQQNNGTDCGIHGARRIYSYWKYGQTLPVDRIDEELMTIDHFRLLMCQYLIENADNVSLHISPTGKGNTIPPHKKDKEIPTKE
jgi:hypothetical protein